MAVGGWFTRPVFHVRDVNAALAFYVDSLGFSEAWRYAEAGETLIIQVDRPGCQIILTRQWPERAGQGLLFVSWDGPRDHAEIMAELAARGAPVTEGRWGYDLTIVTDPDGNQLWIQKPPATA